jgi:hypothetical protein
MGRLKISETGDWKNDEERQQKMISGKDSILREWNPE